VSAVAARQALAYRRRRRRAHRPPGQLSDLLALAYVLVLYALILGWGTFRTLRQATASPAEAARLVELLARLGPAVLLVGLVAALRYATWQGPVVFGAADVQLLLAAPLPRAALVRPRLAWGLGAGAALGGLLGLGAFLLLWAELAVPAGPLLAAALLGPAAVGLLAGALGWLVEESPACARAVLRLSPVGLLLAAALPAAPGAALWSGPWGWAVGPTLAAAGGRVPSWPAQTALLALAVAAAVTVAWRRAGGAPTEELARRAALRGGLAASAYLLDVRAVVLLRQQATRALLGVRRVRLRRPRARWLAIPWRDALAMLRAPGRLGWAAALAGGAILAVAAAPSRRALVAAAVLAGYLAAGRLVESIRVETDQPDAHYQLSWRSSTLMLLHCLLPAAVLAALGILLAVAVWLAGLLSTTALGLALAGVPATAAVLVLAAAIAGRRGRVPVELLLLGDVGGIALLLWIMTGPLLAETLLGVPIALLRATPTPQAAIPAVTVWLALVVLAESAWLRTRKPPS
jgi:nitrate reductase gamma subunit